MKLLEDCLGNTDAFGITDGNDMCLHDFLLRVGTQKLLVVEVSR